MATQHLAVVLLGLAALGGCGGGESSDLSGDDQRAVTSLTAALQKQEGRLHSVPPLTRSQADCVATGLVEAPGTDSLVKYGILRADLRVSTAREPLSVPEGPAVQMAEVITGCVDLARLQAEESGDEDSPAVQKCFASVLDSDGTRVVVLSQLTGDRASMRALTKQLRRCLAAADA